MILRNQKMKLVIEKEEKNKCEMYLIEVSPGVKVIKTCCIIIGNHKSLKYNDDELMNSDGDRRSFYLVY